MGRHAGFIALKAALVSQKVDVCLIPEINPNLDLLYTYLRSLLEKQGFAVVVVAEGVQVLKSAQETDESGNARLSDVGRYLKEAFSQECPGASAGEKLG